MDHRDHLDLLRRGVPPGPAVWADLGSGTGAFTLALAELLGPGAPIISVDKDPGALDVQRANMLRHLPEAQVTYVAADFNERLDLPPLDGLLMANSLHFVKAKEPFLELISGYVKPRGRLIVVEYDTDRGNAPVPFPISYESLSRLARSCGFAGIELLGARPSRFLGRIYSAVLAGPPAVRRPARAALRGTESMGFKKG